MALFPVQPDLLLVAIYFLIGKVKGLICLAITKREMHSIIPLAGKNKAEGRRCSWSLQTRGLQSPGSLLSPERGGGTGTQPDGESLAAREMQTSLFFHPG